MRKFLSLLLALVMVLCCIPGQTASMKAPAPV